MAKHFLFFIALAVVFTLSRSDPDQTPKAPPSDRASPDKRLSAASISRRINTWRLTLRKSPGKSYRRVDGISVKAFFKWWGITGIRSSGDNLVFEVGMVTAKYPSKNFDESPECEGKRSSS
nr:uncharacterized protein LOC109186882 [Ipomoea trifida]